MGKFGKHRIGVLLWNAQVRYQQCRDGVIEGLRAEGFVSPDLLITVEQADGQADTAVQLARRLVSEGVDVLVPVGTSAAVAIAGAVQDRPVVFAFVYDPVASGIARAWKSSGNNTTGSSSKAPSDLLLQWLKELAPIKRLGVLFTPGELNTEAQVQDLETVRDRTISITPVPLKSRDDLLSTMSGLEGSIDALLLTGGGLIGDNATQIVLAANRTRILTATQSQGLERRVLLAVTVNPVAVGRLAGKKAAGVLRGQKPASIEIETIRNSDVSLNLRIAKAIGLEIGPSLQKAATQVLE
jgi:putative ABC transport system substrate-binding protein